MYHGDIRLGDTIQIKFTTVDTSGVPTTLAGTPVVSAYPAASVTELTAGITLTSDFDARTGLNDVTVVATGANGYLTATNYALVITTGTVSGSSVIGYVVGTFSIENRSALMSTTAANKTLDVASTGEAGVDFGNILGTLDAAEIGTGAITAAKFAAGAIDATAIATAAIDADSIATGAITAAKFAANALDAAALAADAATEIGNAVWDTDATARQTLGTFGQAIGDPVADTNTIYKAVVTDATGATVGVDVVSVQADTDNIQTRLPAALVGGRMDSSTGAMAADVVTAAAIANAAIDAATFAAGAIDAAAIAADAIGASELAADAVIEIRSLASGTSDSGTTTTMVDAARTEADTDYWVGQFIVFTSGTISGQARLITAFNAATDTITFTPATTQAVGTQTYEIWPCALADLRQWVGVAPSALIVGRVDANTQAMAANVITSSIIATDAIGAAQIAAAAITVSEAPNLDAAITTRLAPTVAGRTLDIAVGGEAGVDLDNTVGTLAKTTDITGFNDLSAATVKTQVTDALNVDTYAEPGQGTPPATATLVQRLQYLYKAWRNRFTQTSTTYSLYNDDAVTVDQKSTVSDDAVTFDRTEVITGP